MNMTRKPGRARKLGGLLVTTLVLAAVGLLALSALWPEPPRPPAHVASVAALEAYLDELTRFGKPPGLTFAVVEDGRIAYSHGFGLADGPRRLAATSDSVYHWWSLTKIPTAIAVLQLQEQGRLSLDDPVVKHLPFFRVEYPAASSPLVTVRHLLNHSSGLPDMGLALVRRVHREGDPPVNQTAFVEAVLPEHSRLAFEPGSRTSYTNLGYVVLGALVEKVSGRAYEDYVRDHILRTLRMDRTDFVYTAAMRPYEAAGSHPLLDRLTPLLPFVIAHWNAYSRETAGGHVWLNHVYTDYTPSSGLIGGAPDLTRLMLAYLNGGELDGQRILSAQTVATMTHADRVVSPNPAYAGLRQGLGWVAGCGERDCIQHTGAGPGFGTALRLYPREGLGLVVLTNDMTSDTNAILDAAASVPWSMPPASR
jgi:CubicO group peptidase (beta-lactamase class C family)